jgi:hypothetical protein
MVLLGTCSDRDFYKALDELKQRTGIRAGELTLIMASSNTGKTMGQTHEIQKNTNSSTEGIGTASVRNSEARSDLQEVVSEAN